MNDKLSESDSIFDYIVKLNSAEFLPRHAYRRNSISYDIVSMVNNLACCYLAGNYKAAYVFIERVKNCLDEGVIDSCKYRELVLAFIRELEKEISIPLSRS